MKRTSFLLLAFGAATVAQADYTVDMKAIDARGVGASIGTVTIAAAPAGGVLFTPKLKGLPAGERGFHVHSKPACGPVMADGKPTAGAAAGPHWDPDKAGKHGDPKGPGHRGDLPALVVAADGTATMPVTAPRLKLADVANKSLMIHSGGDTFTDNPKPNGGGAERIACGIIAAK